MFIRVPQQDPFQNAPGKLGLILRSERGTRLITLGDHLITVLVVLASILLAWFLFASLYLVLRDDYVVSSLTSERRATYAYEDRIIELRRRIDRMSAHQLINQDSIEVRVAGLVARQAELEARQMVVNELAAKADRSNLLPAAETTASVPALPKGFGTPSQGAPNGKPRPLEPSSASGFAPISPRAGLEGLVGDVERRTAQVEREQTTQLQAIGNRAESEMSRSRTVVAALGLDPTRFGRDAFVLPALKKLAPLDSLMLRDVGADEGSAMGGPLLPPVPGIAAAERFELEAQRAEKALVSATQARTILKRLPVGRPLPERFEQTSGFGTRVDPFVGSLAMHSGIDFRAPSGTPVKAIASGRVVQAGTAGGYGRMVEIDHGHGLTTRYAHLSAIDVSEGETVEKGEQIGAVGSTGRSTGAHLHYEVRIDEDATDPMRFVRAGKLAGM